MPRVKPHAKLHTSLRNHRKTADMFADNDLLATYTRLLLLAVERFADRNGDSFLIHKRELGHITGKHRPDVAAKLLRSLADVSPMSASPDGDVWRITVPNFAKKQGFGLRNGARKENPPSPPPSPPPSTVPPPVVPPCGGDQKSKKPPRGRKPKVPFPSDPAALQQELESYLAAHPQVQCLDLPAALESIRLWAAAGDVRWVDWGSACKGYLRDGWPQKRSRGNGPAREPVPERPWERQPGETERECNERVIRMRSRK